MNASDAAAAFGLLLVGNAYQAQPFGLFCDRRLRNGTVMTPRRLFCIGGQRCCWEVCRAGAQIIKGMFHYGFLMYW